MFCEHCGMNNVDRASVCLRCGYPLSAPAAPIRRAQKRTPTPGIGSLITVGIFMLLSAVLIILTFL